MANDNSVLFSVHNEVLCQPLEIAHTTCRFYVVDLSLQEMSKNARNPYPPDLNSLPDSLEDFPKLTPNLTFYGERKVVF